MSKLWLAFTFAIALACSAHAGETYEPEPILQAAALVQPALLSGPNFHVVQEVPVRGYMANFLIDTKFGPIHADSVEMLAVRVAEIPALETLDHASKTGAFAQALAERGKQTGATVVKVIAHPIDSLIGIPVGVARYFGKQWDKWSGRAQSLSDRSSREFENKGDPYRAPDGPMTASRDAPVIDAPAQTKNRAWYARIGSESGREAKRYLKYSSQRRALAKWLGVDPNSTNPLLNDKLNSLAWAAVWGNFSAASALGEITGTAAQVLSYSGKIDQYVWQLDPESLRERNRQRLLKFCSDDFGVRQFLHRGGFTDTLRTNLVDSIEALKPTSGCDELAELGATTRGEVEARFLVDALALLERQADTAGGSLVVAGAAVVWRTPSGKLLLPLPVDYLTWNPDLATFFDRRIFAVVDKTVLIGGKASMATQRQLTQRGWNLILRAPYAGAPPYKVAIAPEPSAPADAARVE